MKLRGYLPLTVCLSLLAACAQKYETVTPDIRTQMLADLKAGKLTLDCTINCSFTWLSQVKYLHTLDLAERWEDLAVETMRIGNRRDLSYYYLGQAAQGLGYHDAAIQYYKFSAVLANGVDTTSQCAPVGACQGVDLAADLPVLIQVSQDALNAQTNANQTNAAQKPPPQKRPTTKDPGWVMPSSPTQ